MTKISATFKKAIKYLKNVTVGESDFRYATIYGLFCIVMILLKQVFTLVFQGRDHISNQQNYYLIIPFTLILLVCFVIVHVKKLEESNKFANAFIKTFPFLFIILGILIVSTYTTRNARVLSYMVIVITLFWVQIYKIGRRIVVFSFSAVAYIILSYFSYGISENFYLDITLTVMISLIVFIASTILSLLHYSHKNVIDDLDQKNVEFGLAIENLRRNHTSLKISKEITDNMYELTLEVLKNESIDVVLQMVLEKAAILIPNSQAGSILIMEDNLMKFVAANGYDLEKLKSIELKPEETFQASLVDKYEPFIVKNVEVYDEVHMGKDKTKKLKDNFTISKSCLTCSFKYQNQFFGSINIDNFDSEDIFSNDDKYLIRQLAREIEIIVSVHKLYEQAVRPTKYDELTQARTRRYCMHLLRELINIDKNSVISICTIDINNLKTINDDYGHDAGDKYLFEFSEAIRNSDITKNIFGRVGGDEFLLIFNKLTRLETIEQINVIKEYLKKNLLSISDKKVEISFASGISVYGVDSIEIKELIKLSDKRMYEDKFIQKKGLKS